MKINRSALSIVIVSVFIVLSLVAMPMSTALAFTAGPNNAGSGANVTGIGTEPWINPGQITSPGAPYATVALYQGHRNSNYLQGTGYNFSVPLDATITGIEVGISRFADTPNPNMVDDQVRLVKDGSLVGENRASAVQWSTTLTLATYGSPTDLWGVTWTPVDVNAVNFGAALAVFRSNNGSVARNANVNFMQITVYYAYATTVAVECEDDTPVVYGDSVDCTATVTRVAGSQTPTGTVAWTSDSAGSFAPNPCTLSGAVGVSTCTASYTPLEVGSGTHVVTGTYSGDNYFMGSNGSDEVDVTTRPVEVTADPQTKVYGDPDPVFTYQITEGNLVFSDTFTGTLIREPGEDVGQYAILQGTLALSTSYDLTYVGDFLTITPADAVCTVTGYDVTYDGNAHTAEGSCLGVQGETLDGLDLTGTEHTNAGTYNDVWSFTDVTGNYKDTGGTVDDHIAKAAAVCTVTPYAVTYDGNSHTATGACTGVVGESLSGLDLSSTTHTNAGSYSDLWAFVDVSGNYLDQNGSAADAIAKAAPTCVVTGYVVEYDAVSHTATGACTGVKTEPLAGLNLSLTTHTVIGTYNGDAWNFVDVSGNYNNLSGTVNDQITLRLITVTADAKSKFVNTTDPELTYQVTTGSLLAGDTFTGALTRQPGERFGTYAILQGTLALPDYYQITYVGANFTITGLRLILPLVIR